MAEGGQASEGADVPVAPEDLMEVVRLLPDVLFRCHKGEDGKIYWSLNEGGLAEQFGLTTKQIEGKSLEELFAGGASEELVQHFEDAFAGTPTIFTNQIGERHFRHFPQPVFDEDGNVREVVGFIADVTELVEAERRLEAVNSELEAFTYSVSHDLRAPLSAMRIDAAGLVKRMPEGSREWNMASRIRRGTERLASMLEGLLELSRAGRGELERSDVDLTTVAREVADVLGRQDPDRASGAWDIEEGMRVRGDESLVRSLVENLLGNAWKFTRDEPESRISIRADGSGFLVTDNGVGLDPAEAEELFQPFKRGRGDFEGSGIGLATVHRIVERHGGRIEVRPVKGKGACFWFTLEPEPEGPDPGA